MLAFRPEMPQPVLLRVLNMLRNDTPGISSHLEALKALL
jgi:hypothetical protein